VKVSGVIWPASLVRAQLGNRANELQALMMPAAFPAVTEPGEPSNDRQCSQPQWSEFVSSKSTRAAPVRTLRFELAQVRTIDIQSDIDGLAGRIAAILNARGSALRVRTVHDRISEPSDATQMHVAIVRQNRALSLCRFSKFMDPCARTFSKPFPPLS
jgi:hypothetical protein